MIDSGPELCAEQEFFNWQIPNFEHFALIGANWALIADFLKTVSF